MAQELPFSRQSENDASSTADAPANAGQTSTADVDRSNGENTLVVRGKSTAVSSYQITVSERIRSDAPVDATDPEATRAVEDAVRDGRRQYAFSGSITDLRVNGPAMVLVNGEPLSPQTLANAE